MLDIVGTLVGPIVALFKWLTLDIRAVRRVVKRAAVEGIIVNSRALRDLLHETSLIDALTSKAGREQVGSSLLVLTGDEKSAARVFELLDEEITKRLSPVGATMSASAQIRTDIVRLHETVEAASDDRALWETRLASMRPLRAETAREAYRTWTTMPRLVQLLDTEDRHSILVAWALRAPAFLHDAPADVFVWLADMATDAGEKNAALGFLNEGIDRGAHPLGYWEIRRYWLEAELDGGVQSELHDVRHPLVVAHGLERDERLDDAVHTIREWRPVTSRERATRTLMLARIAQGRRDFDLAISLARPLHAETGNPAAALIASRAMIARQTFEPSELHADDLAEALRLLIQTRNDMRRWGEDASEVVALAVTAARLLNDPSRALQLTAAEPEGEATVEEATSTRLRTLRATILAENGLFELAKEILVEEGIDRAVVSNLKALIADGEGDFEAAAAYLSETLENTSDFEEKAQIAVRLAHQGVLHPFVQEQRTTGNGAWADQLTLISEAFADVEGGLDRLKAAAHSDPQYGITLSQVYGRRGDRDLQRQTLRAAATRLRDADCWLVVARLEQQMDLISDAIDSAQQALRAAPESWGATARTHALLIELYSTSGDWDQATRSAKHRVRLLPGDQAALWTLITCQHNAGELDAALRTWRGLESRQRPTHRTHLLVWINLYQQFGEAIGTPEDLRDIAAEWAEDEEIRRHIVGLVILPGQRDEEGDPSASEASADDEVEGDSRDVSESEVAGPSSIEASLIDDYFRDFPNGAIRRLTLDLEQSDSILDQLLEAVGTRPDTSELDDQVFRGNFPLGLICLAHGSTLTEAVISHASGVRFVSAGTDEERARAEAHLGGAVVVDLTALFALSVLPAELRSAMIGAFSRLSIAATQFRDAVDASHAIARFSHAGPSVGRWNGPVARRFRAESHRVLDAQRVQELLNLLRPLDRLASPPRNEESDRDGFSDDVWFAAANIAGSTRPLWSDDAALNRIAAHLGVTTFSTLALIDVLLTADAISDEQAEEIRRHLVIERYIGIPFNENLYRRALELREEAERDIASVIEHLGPQSADEILPFLLSVAGSLTANGPRLEAWISASTRWLIAVSPDSSRSANLSLLATHLTRVHWFLPQTFCFVDAGVRDALDGVSDDDPLVDAVERVLARRQRTDERAAALWLFNLVAAVDPPARTRYTGLVFRG